MTIPNPKKGLLILAQCVTGSAGSTRKALAWPMTLPALIAIPLHLVDLDLLLGMHAALDSHHQT